MNLQEIFSPTPNGYNTPSEDNTTLDLHDVRKTRLTLKQLNRLRVMNDIRSLEHEQKVEKIQNQYKSPASTAPTI
jgi:hypothetical protein